MVAGRAKLPVSTFVLNWLAFLPVYVRLRHINQILYQRQVRIDRVHKNRQGSANMALQFPPVSG